MKENCSTNPMLKNRFAPSDKVIVIERTHTGEVFEWEGEVTQANETFVETWHRRNPITHPQWNQYARAYEKTWTKHYFHPDGELSNLKMAQNVF